MTYSRFLKMYAVNWNLSQVANSRAYLVLWQILRCSCEGCSDKTPDAYGNVLYICKNQDALRVLEYPVTSRFEARPGDVVFRRGDTYFVLRFGRKLANCDTGVVFRSEGIRAAPVLPF